MKCKNCWHSAEEHRFSIFGSVCDHTEQGAYGPVHCKCMSYQPEEERAA